MCNISYKEIKRFSLINMKFIRGLFLYGGFIRIFLHWWYFFKLDDVVRLSKADSDLFKAEGIYTKYRRNKEKILYGQSFTFAQECTIKKLLRQFPEHLVEGLVFGRYILREGGIKFSPLKEYPLAALATVTIGMMLVWLSGLITIILSTNETILLKISLILVFTAPLTAFYYVTGTLVLYPLFCYHRMKCRTQK